MEHFITFFLKKKDYFTHSDLEFGIDILYAPVVYLCSLSKDWSRHYAMQQIQPRRYFLFFPLLNEEKMIIYIIALNSLLLAERNINCKLQAHIKGRELQAGH